MVLIRRLNAKVRVTAMIKIEMGTWSEGQPIASNSCECGLTHDRKFFRNVEAAVCSELNRVHAEYTSSKCQR